MTDEQVVRESHFSGVRHVGTRVLHFDAVGSTNDVAATLAVDPANAGTVVVTADQSAGRGQYGRVWASHPGASLLMSVALSPPPALRRPVLLTAWAAVAVADAARELAGVDARIKWPNDLLVGGKKVCGILIEQGRGLVVGVGLNLTQTAAEFAAAELPDATSLALESGRAATADAALEAVVRRLDDSYARLLDGDRATLEAEWRRRIGLVGRDVTAVLADGSTAAGRLRDLTFDGVELGDGVARVIAPELVRQLRGGE